ncbi:AAA family ATPase [Shewanella chilikensis]|uniref:AAA family ATPase n=1 Tax=Shewanella chilikensis TaxID=558541 RepID=UPI003A979615
MEKLDQKKYSIQINLDKQKTFAYGPSPKSITKDFSSPNLPPFTIITGLNGSGKTHFLEALKNGILKVSGIEPHEIVLFNYTNFLNNSRSSAKVNYEPEELWEDLQKSITKNLKSLTEKTGINRQDWQKKLEELEYDYSDYEVSSAINYFKHAIESDLTKGQSYLKRALHSISLNTKKNYIFTEKHEFIESLKSIDLQVDFFSNSLHSVFSNYHSKYIDNLLRNFINSQGGELPALTSEEFERLNGSAPWDMVDDLLEEAGLPFTITKPSPIGSLSEPKSNDKFQRKDLVGDAPKLKKKGTNHLVALSELSSGETILASLATALFNDLSTTHQAKIPKLLLLDEVDAPLHPSQTKTLIKIIKNTFVKKNNIRVILATHSPSTVAMADRSAVHIMKSDPPTIEYSGKERALDLLTAGVPTLALSFDNRKQVFVESYTDAKRYDSIYSILKDSNFLACSISFIEVGGRQHQKFETNSGCDQVRRLVKELRQSGNKKVYGLIDWDLKNKAEDGIIVIGQGNSYSVENIIMDPLLVFATLVHLGAIESIGLNKRIRFIDLPNLDHETLQESVDFIQEAVLESPLTETNQEKYIGGAVLNIGIQYKKMHGKKLEEELKKCFHKLRMFNKSGDMMNYIIKHVIREIPGFTPKTIIDSLNEIIDN